MSPSLAQRCVDDEDRRTRRLGSYRKYRRAHLEERRKQTRLRMAALCAAETEEQQEARREKNCQAQRRYRERFRAAEQANAADGTQQWWIVYVGCEPGLYTTLEAAVAQTNKCPNQQWRSRKADKREALDYYRARYEANEVVKWVELVP
ncbi:hypothetical protein B0H14DRAFT_3428405 [Mycena olivaceomarginata]|nr:hypothetical protein B0H14DRAFT_3428405 [Mycena olivaceomarginata]